MRYDGDLFDHSDSVLWFQIATMQELPAVMGISLTELLELDEEYNFLAYLRIGYEWFHLTGIKGIADAFHRLVRGESIL